MLEESSCSTPSEDTGKYVRSFCGREWQPGARPQQVSAHCIWTTALRLSSLCGWGNYGLVCSRACLLTPTCLGAGLGGGHRTSHFHQGASGPLGGAQVWGRKELGAGMLEKSCGPPSRPPSCPARPWPRTS